MDYEKLHKDTIAKLQEMVNSGKITVEIACSICTDFVPESEDERIRKELVAFLKETIEYGGISPDIWTMDNANKWLTWLEAQCEHANFRNAIQIGDKVTRNEDGVLVNLSQLNRVAKKQDEHDMGISEATKQKLEDNLNKALEKETPESCNEFLEKQDEQKHVDKVKPKFKVGDRIRHRSQNITATIVDIKKGEYILSDSCGSHMPIEWQDNYELIVRPKFKEGDWIIFNGLTLYVREVVKGFYRTISKCGITNSYDWSIDNAARLWTIQDAKNGDVLEFVDHEKVVVGIVSFVNEKTGKVDVSCLLEDNKFKIGNFYALDTINPHPATKEQRDTLMKAMANAGYTFDFEKKELKKIVQSSTEWSEKDERLFQIVIDVLDRQNHLGNISRTDLIACVRKLKSLRPKKQWKPSEEQMKGLRWVFEFCNTSHQTNVLKELYEQLKQL